MGKSIEEILQKMQAEKQAKKDLEKQKEDALNESREKARQEYLRRNRMFEMAFNPSAAASSAAGAGGGGGTLRNQNSFIAFNFQTGDLYSIDGQGNLEIVAQIFNNYTVLSDCSDDPDFIYYVTYDTDLSKVIFGKFDKVNYQRIDIDDTNLNSEIDLGPNSLYYAGGGNFIYSAESFPSFPDTQSIYSISIDGLTVTQLSTFDGASTTLVNIFEYSGQTFATLLENGIIATLDLIDLNTGSIELIDYFSMNVDTLPNNISANTKVWYVLDVRVKDDQLWTCVVFTDKDAGVYPYACIGKINLEEPSIDFVYSLPDPFGGDVLFTSFVVL